MFATFTPEFQLQAWSACHCPTCGQHEAVRVERMVHRVSIMFVPVLRSDTEHMTARCNFCETPLELPEGQRTVPVDTWRTQKGLRALFDLLAPGANVPVPDAESPQRLQAWLQRAQVAMLPNEDRLFPGLLAGGVLGFLIAAPLGYWLIESGRIVFENQPDGLGSFFGSGMLGLVGGVILGGVVAYFPQRRKAAASWVRIACDEHGIRRELLEQVSRTNGVLHQAVLDHRSKDEAL